MDASPIALPSHRFASLVTVYTRVRSQIVLQSFLIGIATSVVLGGIYVVYTGVGTTTQTASSTLTTVQTRSIVSSVRATGKVTFASEQTLKFNQRGTVKKVSVKEGDRVKQGQAIAELDAGTVASDIRQAQLSVTASQLRLQQLQGSNQKTLDDARSAFKVSQEKLPSDLASAERSVDEKTASLAQAELDLSKEKANGLQSLADTAQSALSTSDKILDSYYDILTRSQSARPILGITSSLVIDHLLFNDPNAAHRVEFAYFTALQNSTKMHTTYGSKLPAERSPEVLRNAISDAHTLAVSMSDFGDSIYTMLQGATTDTQTFTPEDLTALRQTVTTNRTTVATLISTVASSQANLLSASSDGISTVTIEQKQQAVETAKRALTLAQENLRLVQTQTPGDLLSAQQSLSTTMTDTDVQVRLQQNDVSQKIASLQKVQKNLQDYRLVAPFEGIITHIDYKVGDNLLDTGDTEYVVLQNPDYIVVTIPLDQVDVVRVKSGMTARIVFDAVPGQTFNGTIDMIDSTPIVQSGVVSYNVQVKLETPKDLTILSGMTATVRIETLRKDNVLAVPNLAIKHDARGQASVQKADGTSVTVETGASDGQFTEITSGASLGDEVLSMNIPPVQTTSTANTATAQQLLRLGGGGGGGPTGR